MYYVYQKENKLPCVTVVAQDMPLIKITETLENAENALKAYLSVINKVLIREKYHYGYVIGKVDNTNLKCIECVEYDHDFNPLEYDLGYGLNKNNIDLLKHKIVLSDETNVEVLEEETKAFELLDILIWWDYNMKHGSPIN